MDAAKTALLVIDMQRDFVASDGYAARADLADCLHPAALGMVAVEGNVFGRVATSDEIVGELQ